MFAILLPTLSQAIHCDDGLKLREYASQCYNRSLLKKPDPKSPRTALASLPGKNFYKKNMQNGLQHSSFLFFKLRIFRIFSINIGPNNKVHKKHEFH